MRITELLVYLLILVISIVFLQWSFRVLKWARMLLYHLRSTQNIPGPESKPFIGSWHLLKDGGADEFTFFLLREAKKASATSGVMKLWTGPILRLYIFDPEIMRVVTNSTTEIKKAFDYDRFHQWFGNGLVTSHGDYWRKSRKMLTPAFHFTKLEEYANVMNVHARKLVKHLNTKADGEVHNIYTAIQLTALDNICGLYSIDFYEDCWISETAMGIQMNAMKNPEQPYIKAVKSFLSLSFLQLTNPMYFFSWYWKWLGYEEKDRQSIKVLKHMSTEVIQKRIAAREAEGNDLQSRPDFLDMLLNAYQDGQMSFKEIREQVDTFLFAGSDTLSTGTSWVLWCLACHQDVQERLYTEIKDAFDDDTEFAPNKLKELPYLDAVVKETLRMFPSLGMIGRELQNDVQIGEQKLPAGSTVNLGIYLMHHNEKIFPDSWKFDPERFLDDRTPSPGAYMPFSAGPRNCLGQRFANNQLRIFVAHLLYNFRFSADMKFLDNRPRLANPFCSDKRSSCANGKTSTLNSFVFVVCCYHLTTSNFICFLNKRQTDHLS
ncbi:Cyp-29A4 [Aphelenchoides besseyi]|nr:Cyp-29A4 [Aphelenchoides besseyi]KAI6231257.1 Cyp-29A4 [Aphelenchoides besseyi]